METKYISYGIGNRVGDIIYLNKKLKKFPKLHKAVLKHEKNHTSGWSLKDFFMDLHIKELEGVRGDYYKFILTHPSSWVNFSPFLKLEDTWCFDINITCYWIFVILYILILTAIL